MPARPVGSIPITGVKTPSENATSFCQKIADAPFNRKSPKAAVWLMHYFKHHHSTKTNVGWVDCIRELFYTHPTPEERLVANIKTWETLKPRRTT